MPIVSPLKIPYCEDCKWFRRESTGDQFSKCACPALGNENTITREMAREYCTVARNGRCGQQGTYWEPREIVEKVRGQQRRWWQFGRAAEGKPEP